LRDFLVAKNENYGNSALKPLRIFSKSDSDSAIKVRIDDKLSRIANSGELRKNDTIDLIGYLMLISLQNRWTDMKELID
jgi:hypothetical protein